MPKLVGEKQVTVTFIDGELKWKIVVCRYKQKVKYLPINLTSPQDIDNFGTASCEQYLENYSCQLKVNVNT